MIIAIIIISILILAISLTKFYKWNFPLVIISFVLYLIVDDAPIYTTAMILLIIYTIYLIYKIIKYFIIKNKNRKSTKKMTIEDL